MLVCSGHICLRHIRSTLCCYFAKMDGDEDGKIKGKVAVFNDLLAFF